MIVRLYYGLARGGRRDRDGRNGVGVRVVEKGLGIVELWVGHWLRFCAGVWIFEKSSLSLHEFFTF